jgi:hypothetical protein
MPTWGWIIIVVAVAAAVLLAAFASMRAKRTRSLQRGFGPEYDRTVDATGDRRAAERELSDRRHRREELDIRELSPAARERYTAEWERVQGAFVDDPGSAVGSADRLVAQVMRDRGYPMEDFDQRAADVSVDHPQVVDHYRAAHAIWASNERGDATTEDLRRALVHYRALFEELLGAGAADAPLTRDTGEERAADEQASEAASGTRARVD